MTLHCPGCGHRFEASLDSERMAAWHCATCRCDWVIHRISMHIQHEDGTSYPSYYFGKVAGRGMKEQGSKG